MTETTVVCVTGASGFIASHVVNDLIASGKYKVRGTVRDLKKPEVIEHLKAYGDKLQLFEADLLKEGSFKEAFSGCKYVFHVASPFFFNTTDGVKDLVEPAVNGTKNVLREALAAGVKRVILTSSMAAVCGNQRQTNPNHVWTEEDWADSTYEAGNPTYAYSKVAAEKAAWEFVKENPKLELVVINPSFVLGPPLSKRTSGTSISQVSKLLHGDWKDGAPASSVGVCDVRNVSQAHVRAAEVEEAKGNRFLVTSPNQLSWLNIADVLRKAYPDLTGLPTKYQGDPPTLLQNSSKVDKVQKVLGVKLIPFESTAKDMAEALFKLGIVEKK
eukprot:TRINITY_DN5192_c0_g2_i1.p1 TRINITY_DN5192_c0_g2~~TRINITY_DN5192_c0_g2_i1.p1  ORF type:complete len:329 (+),score=76.21 TRINITY_DN5192_c0_g2_i1:68-1054(+)